MTIPITMNDGSTPEPDASMHYRVASNGVFQHRRTVLYESVTPATRDVPGLEPETAGARLLAPRLPACIMEQATAFFSDVFRYCDGEGVVLLFFRPDTQEYRMEVPEQTVPVYRSFNGRWYTSLELRYEHCERPEGFLRCGSIHSHADLSAYASHTDCDDEKNLDGIHAVVGDLHRDAVSLSATLTASGERFPKPTDELLEPFDVERALAGGVPREWLERVHLEYSAGGNLWRKPLTEVADRIDAGEVVRAGTGDVTDAITTDGAGDDDEKLDRPH